MGAVGKKKKYPFDFLKTHLVGDCLLTAVCGRFSQMKSLSAVSPYSRPAPESLRIVRTQSRYEFVTSCHFILGCRQSSLTKRRRGCKLCSARFFPPVAFSPEKLKVVSMLSENYSVQDIGPSYLSTLKDTFLP